MWNRACPLCFAKVPRTQVLTHGDELTCPACHTPLELSRASRVLSAAVGIMAGFLLAEFVFDVSVHGRWFLPLVAAVLAFGFATVFVLFFLSDLVVVPKPTKPHFPHSPK